MEAIQENILKNIRNLDDKQKLVIRDLVKGKLVTNALHFIKNAMENNDPSHDFLHVVRVLTTSLMIYIKDFSNEPLDLEVIAVAALFHDLVDFKYDFGSQQSTEELADARTAEFFSNNNVPQEKIDKILYIVCNLSYRKELADPNIILSPELSIVRDSDRLDAMGCIGLARCFGYSCVKGSPLYDFSIPMIKNMTSEQYDKQTITGECTAFNHFHEKLLHINKLLRTKTGRSIGQKRHSFMSDAVDRFEREMNFFE